MEISLLKQERLNRHWSRAQVEAKTGIPQRSLENWEEEISWPRPDNIEALCELYGKSAKALGLDRSSDIMVVGKKRNNSIIIGTPEGTTMSDFLKGSFLTDLPSRLNSILGAWPRRNLHYEDLQAEINTAVTDYNVCVNYDVAYAVTRRDACKSLMLIPLRLCGLDVAMQTVLIKIPKDTEGLLLHSAAGIAVCWQMRRGKDIQLAYEVISWYIPILEGVVSSQPEKYRKAAATLLTQCFMLQGSLARDIKNGDPITSYDKAMQYALLSGSTTEQAIAHREIACALWHKEDYSQALSHAEQACDLAKNTDRILQSYTFSALMYCQATTENTAEALTALDKARSIFDSSNLPITISYSSSVLASCIATTQRHVGNYEEAATFYTQSIEAPDASALGKLQAFIDRAIVEACRGDKPRDMGLAISHWEQGILGAKELGSERFVHDARKAYPILVSVAASNASLDGFFSFFTSNVLPCLVGLRLPRRSL